MRGIDFSSALKAVVQEQPTPKLFVEVWEGDCRQKTKDLKDNSIHLVVTDPPYFLDVLDND